MSSTVSREKDGATSESVAILDVVFSLTLCNIEMEKRQTGRETTAITSLAVVIVRRSVAVEGDDSRLNEFSNRHLLDDTLVKQKKKMCQKRKEKAGKWKVPIEKVKAMSEDEMFKIMKSGKRRKKAWKRVVNKVSFVGDNFVRKPPKFERFIRPSGLRFKKAHITHPELKTTFMVDILGVKKNPQSAMYTSLGIITKGTIIEVNVSELGLVT